ncbi:hypothetical protein FOZ63_017704, partial [Perkinsus olseni]
GADPEGAKEITMTWKSHTPNPVSETNVLDFRSLNKSAIDDGKCRTANDQKIYREQHPKFLVHKSASQKRQEGSSVAPRHEKPMPSNFVYGKKTRPSTPISHVISNQFGLVSPVSWVCPFSLRRRNGARGCYDVIIENIGIYPDSSSCT